MKRKLMSALFFIFISSTLFSAPPKIGPTPPLIFTPGVPERTVLSNGVVVYLLEDHELPLFNINLELKDSPALENPDKAGLMGIFGAVWRAGGTKTRTPEKLNQELEQNAISVETSADYESAGVSLSCLSKNISPGLQIFSDVIFNPQFDSKQLALAKSKNLESIKRKNETPGNIARRAFRDVVYGKAHIYAREATQKTIGNIKKADLFNLHRAIAVPDGAIISVSGDFKRDEIIKELETLFAGWKPQGKSFPPYDFSLRNPSEGKIFFVNKSFNQSRIVMGAIGISRHDPHHFPMEVANFILGEGGTSRLFSEIRSKLGLAYMVGSFYTEPQGPGLAGVGGQTKAESTVPIIAAFEEQLQKFSKEEPSAEEMGVAKDAILNSFIFRFNSPAQIVSEKASLEFFGYPADYLDKYPGNISAVTAPQVLEMAKKYFRPDAMKIMVVGDKSKIGEGLEKFGKVTEIPLKDID